MRRHLASAILVGATALAGIAGDASAAFGIPDVYVGSASGAKVKADADTILGLADRRGQLPVIVRMRIDFEPEGDVNSFTVANQRTAIANLGRRIVSRVPGERNVKRFETVPFVGMLVDPDGLRALLSDSSVVSITEDIAVRPMLNESVPLIRADKVAKGRKIKGGKGWAVAVLDTGVQRNHPALKGKIVSEACYSTTYPPYSVSVCPNEVQSSTARGSGKFCGSGDCDHGTHVSGIAVGNPNGKYKGVATQASLIPIQVFTAFIDEEYCDPFPIPCYESFTSDQMLALERVAALARQVGWAPKIASVNMSIGGGEETTHCDDDELAPIVANLTKMKIAVVIASGNEYSDTFISDPGCLSKAVTVGSTTKQDAVSDFSNHTRLVNLMAPGSDIVSAIPGSRYAAFSGTSMATPHVAGAWALLRKFRPNASVGKILKALKCSGVKVARNGVTKSRIDVLAAKRALKNGC